MQSLGLDLNKIYTYADYLKWQFTERVELLKGRIYEMGPTNFMHQALVTELSAQLSNYLRHKTCRVFVAPFDVRLPNKSLEDNEIHTVVQPDVVVVCDKSKYDI